MHGIRSVEVRQIRFLVVGSVHLDILATETGESSVLDKMGRISIEIGGTGCNIALNLKQLGATVAMLTAANNSSYSNLAINHLQKHGIDVVVERDEKLPLSAFSAHIDAKGELTGAISSAAVDTHRFSDETVEDCLDSVDCLILECNLSSDSLFALAQKACERMIPVYVAGVSEEKCLRAIPVAPFVEGMFMNMREARYLMAHILEPGEQDLNVLSEHLGATLIVTDGRNGAYVIRGQRAGITHVKPPELTSVKNYLGMGDALMAGTVFSHMSFGMKIDLAAAVMAPLVAAISARQGCNSGEDGVVESMLTEIRRKASYCPTTEVLNRGSIEDEIAALIQKTELFGTRFSLALIDVDHFKRINDTLGHNIGDRVLKAVATSIRNVLREGDMVGRWGGDEFVVLIHGDDQSALKVGQRIRDSVKTTTAQIAPVTLSIGIAQWVPVVMRTVAELVASADGALYLVKRSGRDGVRVSETATLRNGATTSVEG